MTATNTEVRQLGDARHGLQCILYCLLGLWAIAAVPLIVHLDSSPNVPYWPWVGDFIAAIAPGLPPRLARLAGIYPTSSAVVLGLVWVSRRGMANLGRAQEELVLQRSIGNHAYRIPRRAKFAASIAKLRWAAVFVLLAAIVAVLLDVLADVKSEGGHSERHAQETVAVGCTDVHGNCHLAKGESIRITIRSDRVNDTGVWLEAGAIYTLRLMEHSRWMDDGVASPARGFQFEPNAVGIRAFWWAERLRPVPDGRWFQVVGRVDRRKPAFRALGDTPREPYALVPQRDGQLVLMVNDVILRNNTGSMALELSRM